MIYKGKIFRNDLYLWDGTDKNASRRDSTGGTIEGIKLGTEVNVLSSYGDHKNYTLETINKAVTNIGTDNVTLVFDPGTWTIDDDLTLASNFAIRIPNGVVFNVSSGKTLTFQGPVIQDHYDWTSGDGTVAVTGHRLINGRVDIGSYGTEETGINVNGVTYTTGLRVNDIGGSNTAQFVIHRHSTTLQPLILGARSNSNDSTHAAVTAGQSLLTTFASGYTGTHYDLFGSADFQASSLGSIGATSAPGKWVLSLSANGAQIPSAVITADSDKSITYTGTQKWKKGADVASASALSLGAGNYFDITGTTPVTSINTLGVGTIVKLHFDGALTLTHHATDLILPGGANITTVAGDEAEFIEYATGDWRCTNYSRGLNEYVSASTGSPVISETDILSSALTASTWESIGPTGSGADNIWAALDSVPTGADWIEVRIQVSGTSTGDTPNATRSTSVFARKNGSSSTATSITLVAKVADEVDGSGNANAYGITNTKIPVSSGIFDGYWVTDFDSAGGFDMWLVGYGFNR